MRILPANYYLSGQLRTNNKQNNYNVSSKGVTSFLIGLAIKEGSGAIKSRKKIAYLKALQEYVNSSDSNKFTMGLRAVTKTPDAFYTNDGGWAFWLGTDLDSISDLRDRCLYDLDRIPNNSYYNVQTKKDFLMSWFDNGHGIRKQLCEKFSALPDSLYKSFKEEIVDIALFSTKYNQKRFHIYWMRNWDIYQNHLSSLPSEPSWSGEPFNFYDKKLNRPDWSSKVEIANLTTAFDNLKLTSLLDKTTHSEYINKRRGMIEKNKQLLEKYFNDVKSFGYQCPPETYSEYINELKTI